MKTLEAQNARSTKRQKHKTAEGTKRQEAQNGISSKHHKEKKGEGTKTKDYLGTKKQSYVLYRLAPKWG
jgi:hypothetical protein